VVRDLAPEDGDEDDRLILTAAHLVDGAADGAPVLYAPPGLEPSVADGVYCGTIRRRVPLYHVPFIAVDAAVIKPRLRLQCSNEMGFGAPTGVRDIGAEDQSDFIPVRKDGAQTGMTSGELLPVSATHHMEDVQARYTCGWWADGTGGALFAARGDSGAIVVDDARQVVGMVVALEHPGPGASAFVHGIKQVFQALQIDLA
jgi:hypothetical protein